MSGLKSTKIPLKWRESGKKLVNQLNTLLQVTAYIKEKEKNYINSCQHDSFIGTKQSQ